MLFFSLLLNTALLPFVASEYLRFTYLQTLARWRAKIDPPSIVVIGDSIAAGGRMFGRLDTINLGSNGLTTRQILGELPKAKAFGSDRIAVMAGTNDAAFAFDSAELRRNWTALAANPKMVVMLAPHTRYPELNTKIDQVNAIALVAARKAGRPVLDLAELDGPDGRIEAKYTVDGVHLSDAANAIWREKLDEF